MTALELPSDWTAPTRYEDIPGWFRWLDRRVFLAFLEAQAGQDGVVVEIGAYLGRSAVVIGSRLGKADRFVVVDLFGADELLSESAEDAANEKERSVYFGSPIRHVFEANYRALNGDLPEIVQRPSREVTDYVEPNTARFVHIDASHLYGQVAEDISKVKVILRDDGIIAFDDYRAVQAPGTGAAIWEACVTRGLIPVATTDNKLYGTFGNPEPHLQVLRDMAARDARFNYETLEIFGHTVLRFGAAGAAPSARVESPVAKEAAKTQSTAAGNDDGDRPAATSAARPTTASVRSTSNRQHKMVAALKRRASPELLERLWHLRKALRG